MSDPWRQFAPSRSTKWQELTDVSHVSHIASAVSIVRQGVIRPRLIGDESVLKKKRIEVVWLSPNHWFPGYIYGHIAFGFAWPKLLKRYCFWVEAMPYNTPACRFLLTNVDRSQLLQRYHPETDSGPWKYDRQQRKHFWNSSVTMEFMMEDEIQLEDCSETTFVSHNQSICSEGGCREMRFDRFRAGAEFIAAAVSQELDLECLNMTKVRNGHTERSADLANAADELMSRLDKLNPTSFGEIRSSDSEAPALARAVLLGLANRNLKEARALAGLFATDRALRNATETLLRSAFTLPRVANI